MSDSDQGAEPVAQRGRPSRYAPEIVAAVCERMAAGESLRSICRPDEMPAESTVRLWAVQDREGFAAQYARAREAQVEALAEDLLEIADDKSGDPQRDRLRLDTRKWLMSKIAPKKYGDRTIHAGDSDNPVVIRHEDALAELE